MVPDADDLLEQIRAESGLALSTAEHEAQPAPHAAHPLPSGRCAVYVFSLSAAQGRRAAAAAHKVLKVGRAGVKSNARFQSQHYFPESSGSNLARSLLSAPDLWPWLGISTLSTGTVGHWIKSHTDRDNFYLPASEQHRLAELERFIRRRVGSVFEGG